MQTGDTDFIYRNELDMNCSQHDMTNRNGKSFMANQNGKSKWQINYGKSKDLAKRTQSDKVLTGKASKIASDPKYDCYQRGLALMVYNFFDKKSNESGVAASPANKSVTQSNYQLANEFHRKILRKSKR